MRTIITNTLLAITLTSAAGSVLADSQADRVASSDQAKEVYANPFSGDQRVVRGIVVEKADNTKEVVASPFSGSREVVRGLVISVENEA